MGREHWEQENFSFSQWVKREHKAYFWGQLVSSVKSRGHRSRGRDLLTTTKGWEPEVVFATAQATLPSDSVVLTLNWASVIRALDRSWLLCMQTERGFHLSKNNDRIISVTTQQQFCKVTVKKWCLISRQSACVGCNSKLLDFTIKIPLFGNNYTSRIYHMGLLKGQGDIPAIMVGQNVLF